MDDIISLVGPADSERLAYAVSALRPLLEKVRSSTSSSGSGSVSTRHVNLHVQQALNALEAEQVLRLVLAADLGPVLGADWADLDRNLDLDTDHSADGRSRRSSSSSRSSSHDRRAVDPETDRPHLLLASSGALVSAGGAAHQVALTLAALRRYLSSSPSSFDQDISLDVLLCLRVMLLLSAKWSYRDLKQFFSALTYAVMCEDR